MFSDTCWNCYIARQRWNIKIKLGRYTWTLCYSTMHLYLHVHQAQRSQVIHNPHMKDVPREMMISSNSIRLLHSVGEGTSILYKSVSMFYCLLISSTPNSTTLFTHACVIMGSDFQLDHCPGSHNLHRLFISKLCFNLFFWDMTSSFGANSVYVNAMVNQSTPLYY